MSDSAVLTGVGVLSATGVGVRHRGDHCQMEGMAVHESAGRGSPARARHRSRRLQQAEHEVPATDEASAGLGVICGTMLAGVGSIIDFDWSLLERGPRRVSPMSFPNTVINAAAGHVGIKHRLRGVNSTISSGPASSLVALDRAVLHLHAGRAAAIVAAGLEVLGPEIWAGYAAHGSLTTTEPRPFATDADGMLLGEAACAAVVESRDSANARGAVPIAEICATRANRSPRQAVLSERVATAARCLSETFDSAAITSDQVELIVGDASGRPAPTPSSSMCSVRRSAAAVVASPCACQSPAWARPLAPPGCWVWSPERLRCGAIDWRGAGPLGWPTARCRLARMSTCDPATGWSTTWVSTATTPPLPSRFAGNEAEER